MLVFLRNVFSFCFLAAKTKKFPRLKMTTVTSALLLLPVFFFFLLLLLFPSSFFYFK